MSDRFYFLLSTAARAGQRWVEAALPPRVSAVQVGVLFALGEGPRSLAELAAEVGIAPPSMTELATRMTATGLVERGADPADARRRPLALTPAGRTLRAESVAGLDRLNGRLTDGFTPAERAVVARWLTTIRTRFQEDHL